MSLYLRHDAVLVPSIGFGAYGELNPCFRGAVPDSHWIGGIWVVYFRRLLKFARLFLTLG